jgi:hypothetical protein
VTAGLLRFPAWVAAGAASFVLVAAFVPSGRAIGFGLLLASVLVGWSESAAASHRGSDRELARVAGVAALVALGGLLLALVRPVPTAPVSAAIGIAFAATLIGILYAGLLPAPDRVGETGRTRRQWSYVIAGGTLGGGIVAAMAASSLWPASVGTTAGRAEVLVAAAAGVLAVIASAGVVERSWARPLAAAALAGLAVVVAAALSVPMIAGRPELALATVVVDGALAAVASGVAFGSGRVPGDRRPATLAEGLRIAAAVAATTALLVLAIAVDWTFRRPG